jgi:NADH-quinone oxidoreductase subunit I
MSYYFNGFYKALRAALKALVTKRITLRYPDVKLNIAPGYEYDPKQGVGLPGFKGRHILFIDKCTGCQLCSIACENIAQCIEMVKSEETPSAANKKNIFPQIDFGNCVFCGFCVDACPFYAIYMTDDYELSSTEKSNLIFTPKQLATPPKRKEDLVDIKIKGRSAYHD